MDQIVILPTTEKQSSVIQAFLKEMKIRFKTKSDNAKMSEEEFYGKIDKSLMQAEEGKGTRIQDQKNLHAYLDSL